MVKNEYSDLMSRSVSSSSVNSEASIDINDDEDDVSQSPKRQVVSSLVHQNGSVNSNTPSKLSFSISRLLGANSGPSIATSERESESPSLCSHYPSRKNVTTGLSYPSPSSPDSKCQSHRLTLSPYEVALNYLSTNASPNRPMPYNSHYPWLRPNSSLMDDALQSKSNNPLIILNQTCARGYSQNTPWEIFLENSPSVRWSQSPPSAALRAAANF